MVLNRKLFTFKITTQIIENQLYKRSNTMQNKAYAPQIIKTHQTIRKIVDGDGLIVADIFTEKETEVRFLGIDAPEIRRSKKLLQDERETHLPGELLLELGKVSKQYLSSIAPIGCSVTLLMERKHCYDVFGRMLAYVMLKDGTCLNEAMIEAGYAKAYCRYYCNLLSTYQLKNFQAKQEKRGIYNRVDEF